MINERTVPLLNIGPIKRLEAPQGWKKTTARVSQPNHIQSPVLLFRPPDSEHDVEIGVFFRSRLESEADGKIFADLISAHADIISKEALQPAQIKDLVNILDLTGFNQYSFPQEISGYQPDFYLRSAELMPLNGKVVLRVVGDFMTAGDIDTYFCGIYIDADGSGRKIYEIFLRSNNKPAFVKALIAYKISLASISWNQTDRSALLT